MDKDIRDLVYNLLCDLKKKEIDKFVRARLIREYSNSRNISGRQLAKQLGIPKSTIEDWLRWDNLKPEQYEDYKEEGFTHTDIYESLRNGTLSQRATMAEANEERRDMTAQALTPYKREVAIDKALNRTINILCVFKIKPPYSGDTKKLIKQLRQILDTIEGQIK